MKNKSTINKIYTVDDLNSRIDIYTAVRTTGTKGNISFTYSDTADLTIWAAVSPYTTKTNLNQPAISRETLYHIVVRYREDITANDKIVWNDRILKILGEPFNLDGLSKWLQIECKELKQNGA